MNMTHETPYQQLVHITNAWNLPCTTITQLIDNLTQDTWETWKTHPPEQFTPTQHETITQLNNLYTRLHYYFNNPLADTWIHRPNTSPLFNGNPPLHLLIQHDNPHRYEQILTYLENPSSYHS
jgi:hypothetical protein